MKAITDRDLRGSTLLILAEPALAASSLWKRREFFMGRNVARLSSTEGHSGRGRCRKQAM